LESISIREAADRLGVSHKVIRRLISQGTLEAYKRPGAHGAEWRVEMSSLVAYQNGQSAPRHAAATRVRLAAAPPPPNHHVEENEESESWKADKAFLQDQIRQLTAIVSAAVSCSPFSAQTETSDSVAIPAGYGEITASLQSSLRTVSAAGGTATTSTYFNYTPVTVTGFTPAGGPAVASQWSHTGRPRDVPPV